MKQKRIKAWFGAIVVTGLALGALDAAAQMGPRPLPSGTSPPVDLTEVEAYVSTRSLGDSSLPIAFVFGDSKGFCFPGDSGCKQPSLPPGINQPAPVVVGSTLIGNCPVEIRTANIAFQTYVKLGNRYPHGVNTIGFNFSSLQAYNQDSAYFGALIDLVAVPLDFAKCKAGVVPSGSKELGYLSWGGAVSVVSYDGRSHPVTPLLIASQGLHKLIIRWDHRELSLFMDDCRAPIFETPVYQASAKAPAALFPVIVPHVLLAPAVLPLTSSCKRLNVSAAFADGTSSVADLFAA